MLYVQEGLTHLNSSLNSITYFTYFVLCSRNLDPFYFVSYYMKEANSSLTYSIFMHLLDTVAVQDMT